MTQKKKTIRSRHMMYTQQIAHLPFPLSELETRLLALNPEKYAFIVHDKDLADNGQPAEEHIHAMLSFNNPRSVNSVAHTLGDKPEFIEPELFMHILNCICKWLCMIRQLQSCQPV